MAHPRNEVELEAVLEWCAANGYCTIPYGGGSSVVGGVTPPADAGRDRDRRPGPARPGARDRRSVPGGAHPGRRVRPGAGGPAPPPGLHPAALPAELHRVDARRLDRHPLGGPLRHQPHPHRRVRRDGPDAHPAGLVGGAPPAGLGRRAGPQPPGHRLRGDPRHHHRGVDAHPGPAGVPGHRQRPLPLMGSRVRGHPPGRPDQAVAGQPAPPRPGAGGRKRRPRRHPIGAHRVVRIGRAVAAPPTGAGARHTSLLWRRRSR